MGDAEPCGWSDALKFACDLKEKHSLIRVFSIAFSLLAPAEWKDRIEETRTIIRNRNFASEPADMIQIIAEALTRMPKENRSDGLDAARLILGETDFIKALDRLLFSVPRRSGHPWHEIVRQQVGAAVYSKITAGL